GPHLPLDHIPRALGASILRLGIWRGGLDLEMTCLQQVIIYLGLLSCELVVALNDLNLAALCLKKVKEVVEGRDDRLPRSVIEVEIPNEACVSVGDKHHACVSTFSNLE